ncbi:MAG: hypothetical protein DHS20C15_16060 [Planctomycetota bacterium]|nr:MAG: hypothetical protein DHS20C15_16060 [Planctomycetota bacterium]
MAEQAQQEPRAHPGLLNRLLLFTGLCLLVGVVAIGTQPTERLSPPREVPLPVSEAWLDTGPCYVLLHGLDTPSDKGDETSALILLEDGAPLAPHAPHNQMRQGSLGRFSHWGEHLYLSTSDGSDPRNNGRTYVAVIPSELPSWVRDAMLIVAASGAAMALLGLITSRLRRTSLLGDAIPLLGAGLAIVVLLPVHEITRPHLALSRGETQLISPTHSAVAHAATHPGNVTRLLSSPGDLTFEAAAALPTSDDGIRVALKPSEGVAIHDGIARLEPGGPGLVGVIADEFHVDDIGDLLLPARILAGEQLEIGLRVTGQQGPPKIRLAVPVSASEELRPLRITNTLALFLADAHTTLASVEIVNPESSSESVLLDLREVVISTPVSTFLHSTHGDRTLERTRQVRPAVWQSVPGRYRIPVGGARGTLLKGSVTLLGKAPAGDLEWRVSWVAPNGSVQLLHEGRVAHDEQWHDARLRVPREGAASRGGELLLEVSELPAGTVFAWSSWRLVDDSRPPRRVIFAVLDTLRRDAIGALGGTEAETPFLDGLAESGVRFLRAYSQAHWTRPSMPSLMTSRYVASTGVETLGNQLPESYTTLAEAFAGAGYYTLADISNTNAGPAAGLAQGWDLMRHTAAPSQSDAEGQLLSSEVLNTVQHSQEEDLLLYIHLMDAHGPYGPAQTPADAATAPKGTPVTRNSAFDRPWASEPSDASRRHWYYRDVETLDSGLAKFFHTLDEIWGAGSTGRATVAVTADHGEFLGEYGEWGHDWFAELPQVVNVPMILRSPTLPSGHSVEIPVENIDLGPSLLELAEISARALGEVDGRSLLPLIRRGDSSQHGVALAAVGTRPSERLLGLFTAESALVGKHGSLTGTLDPRDSTARIAPATDAPNSASILDAELRSLFESRFAELWSNYLETQGAVRESLWAGVDTSTTTIDPEALRQLEELGYLGK